MAKRISYKKRLQVLKFREQGYSLNNIVELTGVSKGSVSNITRKQSINVPIAQKPHQLAGRQQPDLIPFYGPQYTYTPYDSYPVNRTREPSSYEYFDNLNNQCQIQTYEQRERESRISDGYNRFYHQSQERINNIRNLKQVIINQQQKKKQKELQKLEKKLDKLEKRKKEENDQNMELTNEIQKMKNNEHDNEIKIKEIIPKATPSNDEPIEKSVVEEDDTYLNTLERIYEIDLERRKLQMDSKFRDETFDFINNDAIPMIGNIIEIYQKKNPKKDGDKPIVVKNVILKEATNLQKKDRNVFVAYKKVKLIPAANPQKTDEKAFNSNEKVTLKPAK